MSQAGGNPIGTARIDFTGNVEQLKRDAATAQEITKGSVRESEQASSNEANRLKEARRGVGQVLGAAGAIAAIVGSVDKLLQGIHEFNTAAGQMGDRLSEIKKGLSFDLTKDLPPLEREFDQITKTFESTLKKIEDDRTEYYSGVKGLARRAADELHGTVGAEFDQQRESAIKTYEASKKLYEQLATERGLEAGRVDEAKRRTEQNEKLTKIQEDSIALVRSTATEEQRLTEEVENKIDAIRELSSQRANDPSFQKALDDSERRLLEYLDRRRKVFNEAAEKEAQDYEKAMLKAVANVSTAANRMFNPNNVDSGVGTIIAKIDLIAQQLRRQV